MIKTAIFHLVAGCLLAAPGSRAAPVVEEPWREVVVSVTDIERSADFFQTIGGYTTLAAGELSESEIKAWGLPASATANYRLLAPAGAPDGWIRLVDFDNAGVQKPMRPGARAWDSGCYFSLMVRVKDIDSVYDDAIRLGWWTETPVAPLAFGKSKLRIVIFKGPDGLQVQSYERLAPPLPEGVGPFERMTRPFNVMQMVANHGEADRFFSETLGFATFYSGDQPVTAPEPVLSPIGIPTPLTTTVGYQAGIFFPIAGEYGRMEAIEVVGLEGLDYSDRCLAPNLGILAVRFAAGDLDGIEGRLRRDDMSWRRLNAVAWPGGERVDLLEVQSPDGALIQFFTPLQ